MGIDFSQDQKNAINAKGSVLVYAAAGSGKTAVLTQRVIKRITDPNDPASIERLLIVTFTNASALEMRMRIGRELDKVAAENPTNTEILKQKLLMKSAKICTIDSFCIDLVRKHFEELKISPDFTVADNSDISYISRQAFNNVMKPRYEKPDSEGFKGLSETFNLFNGDDGLYKTVLNVFDFYMCNSNPEAWLKNAQNNYSIINISDNPFAKVIISSIPDKIKEVIEQYKLIIDEAVGSEFEIKIQESFSSAIENLENILKAVDDGNWQEIYSKIKDFKNATLPSKSKKNPNVLLEHLWNLRNEVDGVVKSIQNDMLGDEDTVKENLSKCFVQISELINIVREFNDEYFELLKKNNVLTFAHIEQLAFKLLCEIDGDNFIPTELSREISMQYDEVLVDEYQDNNDLQDSLFYAVSDSGKHLFLVGDVKQSIYGFRNAKPDNFLKHKDYDFRPYDGINTKSNVILSSNYRSRKGVCDFANGICGALMQKETCNIDYNDDEKLVPEAKFPENNLPSAEIHLIEADKNKDEAEAEAIADYIEKTLGEKPFLRDENDKNSFKPDTRYRDFAILMRSPNSHAAPYIEALKKRNIPVIFNESDFYQSPEILTAVSILKSVNNPADDISLISAMSSVVFGISFDEISELKFKFKSAANFYSAVILSAKDGNKKCKDFADRLSDLRIKSATLPIGTFVSKVINSTGLMEIMCSGENGANCKSNLMSLISMAKNYEQQKSGGLSGFLAYFERMAESDTVEEKSLNQDADAVRIISFHGSKGLQFPICIIAGIGVGFNKQDFKDKIIIGDRLGLGLNIVENSIKIKSIAHKALSITQNIKLISEELRLRYVALTRAEERTVLFATAKDCKKCIANAAKKLNTEAVSVGKVPAKEVISSDGFMPMLLSAALLQAGSDKLAKLADIEPLGGNMCGEFKLVFNDEISAVQVDNDIENKVNVNTVYTCSDEDKNRLNELFNFTYNYEEDTKMPSKMAVTELVHSDRDEFAFKSRPGFESKSGLTPAERGTALHKVMQYADYSLAETDIESELSRLYEYQFISQEEFDVVNRKSLISFFNSNVYSRIRGADKVLREYKFMVHQDYKNGKTIVQGIADCIFFEKGKAVIVDFKTDNVPSLEELKQRYAKQLEIYKKAVCEIFEIEKYDCECIIYSMHLSDEIKV